MDGLRRRSAVEAEPGYRRRPAAEAGWRGGGRAVVEAEEAGDEEEGEEDDAQGGLQRAQALQFLQKLHLGHRGIGQRRGFLCGFGFCERRVKRECSHGDGERL